ncbi:MAG: hypothetical protein LUE27_09855 [Clostridia bacterium]|nr:hypothetical protein [Clostridia bacterium]
MTRRKFNRIILAACACAVLASACAFSGCSESIGKYMTKFARAVDNTGSYSKSYAVYGTEEIHYTDDTMIRTETASVSASYSHKSGEIAYIYEDTDYYVDPTGEHNPVTFSSAMDYYKLKDSACSYTAYLYDGKTKVRTAEDGDTLGLMDGMRSMSYVRAFAGTGNLYQAEDLFYYMLSFNGGPGISHRLDEYVLEVSKDSGVTSYVLACSYADEGTGEYDDVSVSYFISGRRVSGYTVSEDSSWTEDGVEYSYSRTMTYELSYEYDSSLAAGAVLDDYEPMA